jgi:Protein of unknown function (DUF4238)
MAFRKQRGRADPARPENVAYRKRFWGTNEALRRAVEDVLSRIEGPASDILKTLPAGWPLRPGTRGRALVMQFLAIHLIRTPLWRNTITRFRENALAHWQPTLPTGVSYDSLVQHVRSDEFWVAHSVEQIDTMASLLGSLHWSLVRFPTPVLITGDQPLVPVPLLERGQRTRIGTFPPGGLLETIEFRFVIDPCRLLILCWQDSEEHDTLLEGTTAVACDTNRLIRGSADAEWFYRPGRPPLFVAPPFRETPDCEPVSPGLLPGYSPLRAHRSSRRREAQKMLDAMLQESGASGLKSIVVEAV